MESIIQGGNYLWMIYTILSKQNLRAWITNLGLIWLIRDLSHNDLNNKNFLKLKYAIGLSFFEVDPAIMSTYHYIVIPLILQFGMMEYVAWWLLLFLKVDVIVRIIITKGLDRLIPTPVNLN